MKNTYITTPIYYPNADPHIGTTYTTILCDVLARYRRLKGENVRYITGIDEHGQKIQEAAIKNNLTEKQWVDNQSERFKNLWQKLNIQYDYFVRTTDENHKKNVEDIIQKVYDNGDIYFGEYTGKYSVSEETFVTESQLVDGKYMGKEVIDIKEESYFFRLSKYQDKLLKFYEENPHFIKPENKRNEVLSFIKQGLQDLSISRTTFNWGIPLKLKEGHIVYVWFDALNSYLTAAGYASSDFDIYWNNSEVIHMVGKDILRFHAIIWPAMLMSAGIKLPSNLAVHGWWTKDGQKMSKSLGNVVNPLEEIEKYGIDAFRYFLTREATFGQDADYSKDAIIQRINSDLSNDLGNLLNRVIGMQEKYFNLVVKKTGESDILDENIKQVFNETVENIDKFYKDFNFSEVCKSIWTFISRLNKYIDETMPWNLYKDGKNERLNEVLYNLVEGLYKVSVLISPIMPETSNKIFSQIGLDIKVCDLRLKDNLNWGNYPNLNTLSKPELLFPRIEVSKKEFDENLEILNKATIDDFKKIEIAVVQIKKVTKINDTMLCMIIDTGKNLRQVVSNIARTYKNEQEVLNKKVIAILNFEPINIKGYLSQAMLLTTTSKKSSNLIFVDDNIKISSIVK